MCGIAGAYSLDGKACPAFDLTIAWSLLSARGMDACGCAWRGLTPEHWYRYFKTDSPSYDHAEFLFDNLRKEPARWVMLHTRHATQGTVKVEANNHPLRYGKIVVVHNGSVWNDDEVFKSLKVKRRGEVDSMAIAAALDVGGIEAVVERCKGNIAIAWNDRRAPESI